jgi:hypothetical protein
VILRNQVKYRSRQSDKDFGKFGTISVAWMPFQFVEKFQQIQSRFVQVYSLKKFRKIHGLFVLLSTKMLIPPKANAEFVWQMEEILECYPN